MTAPLVLASASPYKQALLERLQMQFTAIDPSIDETPHRGEQPDALASRLARCKALTVAADHDGALVIGADQVAALGNSLFGKPGSPAKAREQLRACSGKDLTFFTAVALVRGASVLGERCIVTEVSFRDLDDDDIDIYVAREKPLDCAGSFRWEGLGIVLFRSLRSADPTALEGLPLIALTDLLREAGLNPLASEGRQQRRES